MKAADGTGWEPGGLFGAFFSQPKRPQDNCSERSSQLISVWKATHTT